MKYMVAAHMSKQGASEKDLTIHQTTLLPSIRGFGPLMAMIFCPNMDLKRDIWKSRYISVRTGLGYDDEKGCPYFAEHDTVFALDFQFTEDDLTTVSSHIVFLRYSYDFKYLWPFSNFNLSIRFFRFAHQVNQIRYFINTLLFSFGQKNRNEAISADHQLEVMRKLKEVTLKYEFSENISAAFLRLILIDLFISCH